MRTAPRATVKEAPSGAFAAAAAWQEPPAKWHTDSSRRSYDRPLYILRRHKRKNLSAKNVAEMEGATFARAVYETCAEKLGLGLSILIDILNPEVIVIGSIYERNTSFQRENRKGNEKEAPAALCCVRNQTRKLGDSIGDIAALAVAAGGFKKRENNEGQHLRTK